MKIRHKFIHSCVIFTIITLVSSVFGIDGEGITNTNLIYRFIVTVIAVYSFYIFEWLDEWPLRVVELIHFAVSLGLVLLFALITHHFIEPVTKGGYIDLVTSYTTLYVICSIIYEIRLRIQIRNQNRYIKVIQSS